ncbi:MAG: hypothetical protein ACYTEN_09145 [Planctomycetota bacterium]|jgi:hypothetical protein
MKRSCFIIVFLLAVSAFGGYRISWCTVDSGGGTSAGGAYRLTGTIGQPDADYLNGGQYELLGGYWVGGPLCIANLADFATLAAHWMDMPCNEANNWCGGADLDKMGDVGIADLMLLADYWLGPCPTNWPQ